MVELVSFKLLYFHQFTAPHSNAFQFIFFLLTGWHRSTRKKKSSRLHSLNSGWQGATSCINWCFYMVGPFSHEMSHIMKDMVLLNTFSNYNITNRPTFNSRPVNSVYNGTESLWHMAPKTRELVPNDIKALDSCLSFKMQWNYGSQ